MLHIDILRSFTHSVGRFVSIAFLIALGTFALVGLSAVGPNMRATGHTYFSSLNLADISVISDYGLDDGDQEALSRVPGTDELEFGYLKDVAVSDSITSVRIFSAPETVSEYEVVEGRMPASSGEIALDAGQRSRYALGDPISFTEKPDASGETVLETTSFTVVGFVNSSEILASENLGSSTSGSGRLDAFGVVVPEEFDSDVAMIARMTFTDLNGLDEFGQEYQSRVQAHRDAVDESLAGRPQARLDELRAEIQDQIDTGQSEVDKGRQQLDDAQAQLNQAKAAIADAKQQLSQGRAELAGQAADAQQAIGEGRVRLAEGQAEIVRRQGEYDTAAAQMARARQQISDGQARIDQQSSQLEASRTALAYAITQLVDQRSANDAEIAGVDSRTQEIRARLAEPDVPPEEVQQLVEELAALQARRVALLASNDLLDTSLIPQAQTTYDDFMSDVYTPGTQDLAAAQSQVDSARSEADARQPELDAAGAQLQEAKAQAAEAQAQVTQAQAELDTATADGQRQLAEAQAEIEANEAEYQVRLEEFTERKPNAERELADAEQRIAAATEQLNALETPVLALDTRREAPGSDGYIVYDTVAQTVDSLARIYPYFLYFVAALVAFTTMTRFVEEERTNAGTLKALGYGDREVMEKFVAYGLAAAIIGLMAGILLGHYLLPMIAYDAYADGFVLPRMQLHWQLRPLVLSVLLGLACTVLPALYAAWRELRERPTYLLRPKPPASGSTVPLEHLGFVWRRMSFTQKVTARNIFRYRQRTIMTIFGVCGAVAVLMSGLAVQGSIAGIGDRQFGEVIRYDLLVAQRAHVTKQQQEAIDARLGAGDIEGRFAVHYEELTRQAGAHDDKQPIALIVPEDVDRLDESITLVDATSRQPLLLTGGGAIITQRLAELTGVGVGDDLTVSDARGREHSVRVDGISEMYINHFIFMSPGAYEQAFGEEASTTGYMLSLADDSESATRQIAAEFMALDGVQGVISNTTYIDQVQTIVDALNQIMYVLILVAALLGVVILYNLTNLNVSERIRELSTIKVLGFYEREVTMYIYRETISLSLVGILVGYLFGAWLHRYIITQVPPDRVMFDPTITWPSYVIPAAVIVVITIVLGLLVNRRLRDVDMLAALKSTE